MSSSSYSLFDALQLPGQPLRQPAVAVSTPCGAPPPDVVASQRSELLKKLQSELDSNQQLLLSKSLLNKNIPALDKLTNFFGNNQPLKILSQTMLSYSAKGTGYEGWTISSVEALYSDVFAVIEQQGLFAKGSMITSAAKEALQQLRDSTATPQHHALCVSLLGFGQSYTIEGGWNGVPPKGHAMLYRFERQSNNSFNIYIYNAQKESDLEQGGESKLWRRRTIPFTMLANVTYEELFFCPAGQSNIDSQIFINLDTILHKSMNIERSVQDVLNCFIHLAHRRVPTSQLPRRAKRFISMQRSGNCPVKCTNCLLLDLIDSEANSKKISLDLRLFIVMAAYRDFTQNRLNSGDRDTRLFQLKQALANCSRAIDSHFQRKKLDLSQEQYLVACATLKEMHQGLSAIEGKIAQSTTDPLKVGGDYDDLRHQKLCTKRSDYIRRELLRDLESRFPAQQGAKPTVPNPNLGKGASWQQLDDILKKLEDIKKGLPAGRQQAVVFQIEATLCHLSHLKQQSVANLEPEQARLVQQRLLDMQETYYETVKELGDWASPAVQNSSMEFLALSYRLGVAADKSFDVLGHYGLEVDYFFKAARQDRLFSCQNRALLEQRQQLEAFFKELGRRPKICNATTQTYSQEAFTTGRIVEGRLYQSYIQKSPQVNCELANLNTYPPLKSRLAMYGAEKCFTESCNLGNLSNLTSDILAPMHTLRKAAILACGACLGTSKTSSNQSRVTWDKTLWGFRYDTPFHTWLTSDHLSFDSSKTDFSPDGELKTYVQNSQSEHQIEQLTKENSLVLRKEPDDEQFSFFVSLSEPKVQTSLLVQAAENQLELLSQPTFRQQLLHMFLKNVEKEGVLLSPFIEAFQQDPAYLRKFDHLIHLGLKTFVDSLPESSPKLDEMLFLIRLYARALHQMRDCHPSYSYPPATQQTMQKLRAFLDRAPKISKLTEEQAKEVHLAKQGLMLGVPLKELASGEQAQFLLATIAFQNEFPIKGKSSDPSFVRECKRILFSRADEWSALLSAQPQASHALGNDCLRLALAQPKLELQWHFDSSHYQLIAGDATGEVWTIDLQEPSISNTKGALKEVRGELRATNSFTRLFGNKRYDLKIFGKQTYFQSPLWGAVKITDTGYGETTIERQIGSNWFTYVPKYHHYQSDLQLNDALFGDLALWVNNSQPEDIRFCDLQTAQERYRMGLMGQIIRSADKMVAYILDENIYCQLNRFENPQQILGFTESKGDFLEFNRLHQPSGQAPLTFSWDGKKQKWLYSDHPSFHIFTGPEQHSDFQIDRFLLLENDEGTKRKMLVPCAQFIDSQGYAPKAALHLPHSRAGGVALDKQRGSISYFEYDIAGDGALIPQSLEGRIYLAHLYLAQKQYKRAAALIKAISVNENITENIAKTLTAFLLTSEACKDSSPNACACHLWAYHTLRKINPFCQLSNQASETEEAKKALLNDYAVYVEGRHKVEEELVLNKESELELIQFLQADHLANSLCNQRSDFLNQQLIDYKTISIPALSNPPTKIKPPTVQYSLSFHLTEEDKKKQESWYIERYFRDSTYQRLYNFYTTLRSCKNSDDLPAQKILYHLISTGNLGLCPLSQLEIDLLYFVASHPQCPALPHPSSCTKLAKFQWFTSFKAVYEKAIITDRQPPTFHIPIADVNAIQESCSDAALPPPSLSKAANRPLFLVEQKQDKDFITWQERFLAPPTKRAKPAVPLSTAPVLKDSEKSYAAAVQQHREYYHSDRQKAQENEANKRCFKKDCDYALLIDELQKDYTRSSDVQQLLLAHITTLIERAPTSSLVQFAGEHTQRIGAAKRTPTLDTILRTATPADGAAALQQLNPHLTDEEATQLRALCIELMIEATHARHIQRIFTPLKAWLECLKKGMNNATYLELAQEALAEKRQYNPNIQTFPLLFEYMGGLRVRAKQALIVNDVLQIICHSKNEALKAKAFQMIMGGGKTSVIISLLIEMISEEGSLSCVMCHHSQLASVKGNLSSFQAQRFNKDLFILDYSIQDLSKPEILDFIIKQMNRAKHKRCALLMKTSFPQVLQLKFILEASRLCNTTKEPARTEHIALVEKLRKINQIMRSDGVSIYDECDINLSINTEVNIPQGLPKNISDGRTHLVKFIYTQLIHPEIRSVVGLDKNQQAELSTYELEETVLPFIAKQVAEYEYLLLGNEKAEIKQAFQRYLLDKIPAKDQEIVNDVIAREKKGEKVDLKQYSKEQQDNIAFLKLLHVRYHSDDKYAKESADLAALARNMFSKVLKVSLSRTFNRHYGRDPHKDDGSVRPYLAVGTPAHTKFGNIYISLAYQFQCALNSKISKGEISFLAKKMQEAATHYARKEGKNFLDTAEAQQFQQMTSVSLVDINTEEGLQRAWEYINDPEQLQRRLEIEAEIAPFHVRYYPERVSNNPVNNVHQFKKSIACSGTLWNYATYHRYLKTPLLDKGTEGAILNRLDELSQKCQSEGRDFIHEVKDLELDSFFALIQNHPQKEKLRAIVDGGGLLRDYLNEDLAIKFKEFLYNERQKKGGPQVSVVVYLHKFSPEEVKQGAPKESFVLLKLDDPTNTLHILKNTSNEAFEKHGIKKEEIFLLCDELRATGTDIELDDDAFFLFTCDHKMPMRTALQETLRARKIFKEQTGEFIVTAQGRKEMVGGAKSFADLQSTWEKNEAILLKDQKDRGRLAQIEDIARSSVFDELLSLTPGSSAFANLIETSHSLFFSQYQDEPFSQYGKIEGRAPSIDVLKSYGQKIKNKVAPCGGRQKAAVESEIETLLNEFKQEIAPGEMMAAACHDDLDAEVEQEQEVEVEVELEQEQEVEVSLELLNELQSYSYLDSAKAYKESPWHLDPSRPLWGQLQKELLSLPEVLAKRDFPGHKIPETVLDYAACFPDHLYITNNFYYTSEQDLPLLHPHIKEAKFVLAVESSPGKYKFLLLSENDAAFFKDWLRQHQPQGAFLLDLKGQPEVNMAAFDGQSEQVHRALVEGVCYANLFNGQVEYLEEHKDIAKKLVKGKEKHLERYLILKVIQLHGRPAVNKLMFSSIFTFAKQAIIPAQGGGVFFSSRRKLMALRYSEVRQIRDPALIAALDPDEVPNLTAVQVKWLTTAEQVRNLPDKLVNELTPKQIESKLLATDRFALLSKKELIQAIEGSTETAALKPTQFACLSVRQLEALQTARLLSKMSEAHIQQLVEAEQIRICDEAAFIQKLSAAQVNLIDAKNVGKLKDSQLPWLTAAELLNSMAPAKVGYIKTGMRSRLTQPHLIASLPDDVELTADQKLLLGPELAAWAEEQLKRWHVPYLAEERIAELKREDLVRHIPTKWAGKISGGQAALLKRSEAELIGLLSYPALLEISKGLSDCLTAQQIAQLEAKDREFIHQLKASQANHLKDEALQCIQMAIVNDLQKETIKRLQEPELLLALKEEKWPELLEEQKQKIRGVVVDKYDLECVGDWIGAIPDRHLLWLNFSSTGQVSQIPTAKLHALGAANWPLISEEQLKAILKDREEILTEARLQKLELKHLQLLGGKATVFHPKLAPEQIGALTKEHLQFIQALDKQERLAMLSDEALQLIEEKQLTLLSKEDMQRVSDKGLLLAAVRKAPCKEWLKEEQKAVIRGLVADITEEEQLKPEYVSYLAEERIAQLTRAELVKAIAPEYAGKLVSNQIALLTKEERALISVLTAEQAEHLTNEALQCIDPKIVNQLKQNQFKHLLVVALLFAIDEKNWQYVESQQKEELKKAYAARPIESWSSTIPNWHLELLTLTTGQIDKLPLEKLQVLSLESFKHISQAQLMKLHREQPAVLDKRRRAVLSNEQLACLAPRPPTMRPSGGGGASAMPTGAAPAGSDFHAASFDAAEEPLQAGDAAFDGKQPAAAQLPHDPRLDGFGIGIGKAQNNAANKAQQAPDPNNISDIPPLEEVPNNSAPSNGKNKIHTPPAQNSSKRFSDFFYSWHGLWSWPLSFLTLGLFPLIFYHCHKSERFSSFFLSGHGVWSWPLSFLTIGIYPLILWHCLRKKEQT